MDRLETMLDFLSEVEKEELIDWLEEKKHPRHGFDEFQCFEIETLVETIQGTRR